ncbi:MAG: hypothetical protein JO100_13555 [Pseudonocardia sp.]|jgi:hypothetical protein|nr:hypothetical protein [Pseudonocardia sp.]
MKLAATVRHLLGWPALPEGFSALLDPDEHVLASASVSPVERGEMVVASSYGLWLPERRRVGWHLVSKAIWGSGVLTVIEAEEQEEQLVEGAAAFLTDLPPRRLALSKPGRLPNVVHERVTSSIRSRHRRDLPGGGAWFVQRKVPGRGGLRLQVRPDPGTDEWAVRQAAVEVAVRLSKRAPP